MSESHLIFKCDNVVKKAAAIAIAAALAAKTAKTIATAASMAAHWVTKSTTVTELKSNELPKVQYRDSIINFTCINAFINKKRCENDKNNKK